MSSPPGATGPNGRFRAILRPAFALMVAQPRSFGSSNPAPAVARCFYRWRYPAFACGRRRTSANCLTRRHEDVVWAAGGDLHRNFTHGAGEIDEGGFAASAPSSCLRVKILPGAPVGPKSRPGATTPRRSGMDPAGFARRTCLLDGFGTEYVPQQSGLFLGLLAFVRRFPPRIRGRKHLRALPLGRELWFPRHGRSPERSVFSILGASAWRGVNAAGQSHVATRGYDRVARWPARRKERAGLDGWAG